MWKVNLNECIKVKLSDFGKDIYYHQYDEINEKIKSLGGKPIESTMPEVDTEGYTQFQMWEFMNLYGEYMTMGSKPVLETLDVIICDGELAKEDENVMNEADTYCGKCIKADVCGMENVYDPATTYCAYRITGRPHGEWVENKKYNRRGKKFLNCSVCNYGKDGDICCEVSSTPNFCPNCGADMRGDAE